MAVQLVPESGGSFRLGLYGEVGYDITTAGVSRALKQADGAPITISVDSYGGDALQGIAIHNLLARYKGKKRSVVEGVAASAASLFPLAADERIIPANAFVMVHNAWGGSVGSADDLRSTAELLERISASYRKTYAGATGQDEEMLAVMMEEETWLDGPEAVANGFATEVSEARDIQARAIPEGRFLRVPAALTERLSAESAAPGADEVKPGGELESSEPQDVQEPQDSQGEDEEPKDAEDCGCDTGACPVAADSSVDSKEVHTLLADTPTGNSIMSDAAAIEAASIAAREEERARTKTIRAMVDKAELGDSLADELIDGGSSVDEARARVLEVVTSKKPEAKAVAQEGDALIGLSAKEAQSFSFKRAYLALANPNDKALQEAASFEFEVSRAAQAKSGRPSAGIQVPYDVLKAPARADLTVGTPADGGFLVDDELRPGDFIELLRNRLALSTLGATVLTGLQGDISIPRQTSASTAYWVGEGGSPTESQPAVDQVNMSPKTLGAYVDYSRKLLLQSSVSVEGMIRDDLVKVLALEIDRAGLYGTGSANQPLGLSGQSGIATKELTGYGTFAELVDMETLVATANADIGSLGYLMNAASRGTLKTTEKATGTNGVFVFADGEVNGYRAVVSNQIAAKDIFFGDWSQMVMALWGGLDLMVDPYAGSTSGTVRVVALQSVDFAVKQPTAFTFAQDLVS